MSNFDKVTIETLVGKTFQSVTSDGDCIYFRNKSEKYELTHMQDCCERVYIDDIAGDLSDLENTPIVMSEEVSGEAPPLEMEHPPESYTWTFYKFATVKGYVTVRFFGQSNGCYSESASLYEVEDMV